MKKVHCTAFLIWLVCLRFLSELKKQHKPWIPTCALEKEWPDRLKDLTRSEGRKKELFLVLPVSFKGKEGNQGLSTKDLVPEKIDIIQKFDIASVFKLPEVL